MKREEIGACVFSCVSVCLCVRSINLYTDFSSNAWTLSGPRAEWLCKAPVQPCPAQGTAQVLLSAAPGELPHWANDRAGRGETTAHSLLAI